MKRGLLMLTYYFPPLGMGGVQRMLKFAKYLPAWGWRPLVVTVKEVAYYAHDPTLLEEIPGQVLVYRTGSLDPLRLAALAGYRSPGKGGPLPEGETLQGGNSQPQKGGMGLTTGSYSRLQRLVEWCCFPDSKIGWVPFAFYRALRISQTHAIHAIHSSFPPASAHLLGLLLKKALGKPWLADFRDDWTGGEFDRAHPPPFKQALSRRLEKRVLQTADRVVAVSQPIADRLQAKSGQPRNIFRVIPNGYDPEDFSRPCPGQPDGFTITYSGALSPQRNPEPFLRGWRALLDEHPAWQNRIKLNLVGACYGLDLAALLAHYRLADAVCWHGYCNHRQALTFIRQADLLLLLITSDDRRVAGVPTSKLYEYLATGRPILAVAPEGMAQALIEEFKQGTTVAPEDIQGIKETLYRYVQGRKRPASKGVLPSPSLARYDRRQLTGQLAKVLADVC